MACPASSVGGTGVSAGVGVAVGSGVGVAVGTGVGVAVGSGVGVGVGLVVAVGSGVGVAVDSGVGVGVGVAVAVGSGVGAAALLHATTNRITATIAKNLIMSQSPILGIPSRTLRNGCMMGGVQMSTCHSVTENAILSNTARSGVISMAAW